MIVKILGMTDIIAAVSFFINNNFDKSGWFPNSIVIIFGIFLLVKGVIFLSSMDIASILDIICAAIIFVSVIFFPIHALVVFFVDIYLILKGFISIIA